MVGAAQLPGNPWVRRPRAHARTEADGNLLQDLARSPKQVIVDLGYRGVDAGTRACRPSTAAKYKLLNTTRSDCSGDAKAIEPLIGHIEGRPDGLVLAAAALWRCAGHRAAGYNIRWSPRDVRPTGFFCALSSRRRPPLRRDGRDKGEGVRTNTQRRPLTNMPVVTLLRWDEFAGLTEYPSRSSLPSTRRPARTGRRAGEPRCV
jgi:hypothetical protein